MRPSSSARAVAALMLAGVGAGLWPDVDTACRRTISVTGSTRPNPAAVATYERSYQLYRGLYPALKPTFDAVG